MLMDRGQWGANRLLRVQESDLWTSLSTVVAGKSDAVFKRKTERIFGELF